MTEAEKVLSAVAERIETGRRFALVTIVAATGSTPREIGSRMIVDMDGSIVGSVGGGALERLAIEHARQSLQTGRMTVMEFDLSDTGPNQTGMICGGKVSLMIEPFGVGARLHLFGAGHVSQAISRIVLDLGFDVTVYDARPEWANRERFPTTQIVVGPMEELVERLTPAADDFIAIMTWSHDEDYKVLTRLLPKPFAYLGVIGSRRKAVEVREKLRRDGFPEELIGKITCPIGISLSTHTPAEIAVSFAAQLLEMREKMTKANQ